MKYKVIYKSIDDGKVLIRTFKGTITVDDIISSWKHILEQILILEKHKGVITDYRESDELSTIKFEDTKDIKKYIEENFEVFKNLKLAVVIDSPKIVVPILFMDDFPQLNMEIFSTMRAAKHWIK